MLVPAGAFVALVSVGAHMTTVAHIFALSSVLERGAAGRENRARTDGRRTTPQLLFDDDRDD